MYPDGGPVDIKLMLLSVFNNLCCLVSPALKNVGSYGFSEANMFIDGLIPQLDDV
jgi:hypothetical protein